MNINDIIYIGSFALFLTGAYLFFRSQRKRTAHRLMLAGILVDFFATVIPHSGFKSVAINVGSSLSIVSAMALAVLVWLLFLVSIFVRVTQQHTYYCRMLILIIILWFVDLVLFLYAVYRLY